MNLLTIKLMKGSIIMYEGYPEYERIDSLTRTIEDMKIERGDYGFFSNVRYLTPWINDIREQVKKELTVEEWELVNRCSIAYSKDDINRVIDIIKRLMDKGVIGNPIKPMNYSYTPWSPGQPTPPYQLFPTPATSYPNAFNTDTESEENKVDDIIDANSDVSETDTNIIDATRAGKYPVKGEVIEITADVKYADKIHEIFKGTQDYIDSRVIIEKLENAARITICVDELSNPTQVKLKMSEVLGLLFKNDTYAE